MATDATGPVTSPDNIPTYNTSADAPSGKGLNAIVAAIQAALSALRPSSILGYPADATKFLRGDGTWSAPAAGGMTLLWDSTDAGVAFPAASISTPALPQTYKHLRVQIVGQSNVASANTNLTARLNGDAGTNYYGGGMQAGTGSAPAQLSYIADTKFTLGFIAGATVGGANVTSWDIVFYNYSQAGTYKGFTSVGGGCAGVSIMLSRQVAGEWVGTNPISSLTFYSDTGSFVGPYTRISVYGMS